MPLWQGGRHHDKLSRQRYRVISYPIKNYLSYLFISMTDTFGFKLAIIHHFIFEFQYGTGSSGACNHYIINLEDIGMQKVKLSV